MTVHNELASGHLEKTYENALRLELMHVGLRVKAQVPRKVVYRGEAVGEFFTDLEVEDRVLLELKAATSLHPAHRAQCINYLKISGLPVCLLLNFGTPSLKWERLVR